MGDLLVSNDESSSQEEFPSPHRKTYNTTMTPFLLFKMTPSMLLTLNEVITNQIIHDIKHDAVTHFTILTLISVNTRTASFTDGVDD